MLDGLLSRLNEENLLMQGYADNLTVLVYQGKLLLLYASLGWLERVQRFPCIDTNGVMGISLTALA